MNPLTGYVARMPLRIRLVAATTLLLVVGLAVSGFVAATTLRGYLVDRVDEQLAQAADRYARPVPGVAPPDDDRAGRPGPDGFGPTELLIVYVTPGGQLISVHAPNLGTVRSRPQLPALTTARVTALSGRPFSVHASSGGSQWRLVARPLDGFRGTVVVGQSLSGVDHTVGRLELLELLIGLSVVVVLAGAGYVVVRRSLRPLTEVEHTAAAIAAGDLAQRVPEADERTEVGRLSAALNGMLGQIERAFRVQQESETAARRSEEQMRQFVADASHELRTPLTSIRGFSELYRQGAVGTEEELQRVMRRIEDEAARMGVLVDDLLLLARLDQQRPLEQRPVDLVRLARDAVEDARMVAPDRAIDLVTDDPDDEIVVTGDDLRLRQVLGNLVGNALTYTPAGTPVTVAVRDAGTGYAELAVIDKGPGLPPEQAERVFERFYRADPSRTRGHGGAGLGLAIVDGLARAHGGSVTLETGPGAGATFCVRIPLALAESAQSSTGGSPG